MIVNRSANAGATRCHMTRLCGNPCRRSNGGPLPPTTAAISAPETAMRLRSKPGKKSGGTTGMPALGANQGGVIVHHLAGDMADLEIVLADLAHRRHFRCGAGD